MRQSTIGAKAFDGRVRDGIGSDRLARATRPAKNGGRTTEGRTEHRGPRTERREAFPSEAFPSSVVGRPSSDGSKTGFRATGAEERSVLCHPSPVLWARFRARRALATRAIKSDERLVPVSFTRCRASTSGLSTWWSSTALQGELVLRLVSRLDAFSGYPFHM